MLNQLIKNKNLAVNRLRFNDSHRLSRAISHRLLLVSMLFSSSVWSAELIMIEQDGCHYCMVFDKEILPEYSASSSGQLALLRRVNLANPWPADLSNIKPDRLTPTFVLVHENQEFGRLRGYPGEENFWELLLEMLAKLPKENQ